MNKKPLQYDAYHLLVDLIPCISGWGGGGGSTQPPPPPIQTLSHKMQTPRMQIPPAMSSAMHAGKTTSCEQTTRNKNITFPQLRLRVVKIQTCRGGGGLGCIGPSAHCPPSLRALALGILGQKGTSQPYTKGMDLILTQPKTL